MRVSNVERGLGLLPRAGKLAPPLAPWLGWALLPVPGRSCWARIPSGARRLKSHRPSLQLLPLGEGYPGSLSWCHHFFHPGLFPGRASGSPRSPQLQVFDLLPGRRANILKALVNPVVVQPTTFMLPNTLPTLLFHALRRGALSAESRPGRTSLSSAAWVLLRFS